MANHSIRKAAVIGAGVMGRGIAAHLASAHIPVVLFDIVPPKPGEGDDVNDPAFRNRFATSAIERIKKDKPALILSKEDTQYITPANTEDHLELLRDCDWIVEVVPEVLSIKQKTFDYVEEYAKPTAIISSNTSGLSVAAMTEGRSDDFKRRFMVTHFFNPVRYLKLLELVPTTTTDPALMDAVATFGRDVLGKGIVYAKDTTNFIGNRIGTHFTMAVVSKMEKYSMTPTAVDVIFGKPLGRPKSAIFGTADVVGLDTFKHVAKNCYDTLVDDEEREIFQFPEYVDTMLENGWLGRKSGQGFFRKNKKTKGIDALNIETMEYEPRVKPRFDSIGAARGAETTEDSVRAVLVDGSDDAAKFALDVTLHSLSYTSRRIGEIADDVVNIDNGLKWGYNLEQGPFETWDTIGVQWGVDQMKEHGYEVAGWVTDMLAAGHTSFYKYDGATRLFYDVDSKGYKPVPSDKREQSITDLRRGNKELKRNDGATLYDAGDQVLALEFHTKMNAIDMDIISMMEDALEELDRGDWAGLVIANDGKDAFSAGANIGLMAGAAAFGQWDQIESLIKRLQDAHQNLRYSAKPVITCPKGLALGGGAEVTMAGNASVAASESFIGLVEVGVGLIPGGTGTVQLMRNIFGEYAADKDFDPFPFIRKAFLTIATAQVSTSGAQHAVSMGFLKPSDVISLAGDQLLFKAKTMAIAMAEAGFRPPRPASFRLPGRSGYATIDMLLYSFVQDNQASEHDRLIGQKLATVLTGGDTTKKLLVTEERLIELEREAFLSLLGEEKTRERMMHMVMKGKPLRN